MYYSKGNFKCASFFSEKGVCKCQLAVKFIICCFLFMDGIAVEVVENKVEIIEFYNLEMVVLG